MYLSTDDNHDIMLLCLAETCLAAVANRSTPKSRRHNKLLAAVKQIEAADATYSGTLNDADFEQAEKVFDQVEAYLAGIHLQERPCPTAKG